MDIDGVNALVAGGASGLGAATARRLAAAGAHVTIADLNDDGGAATAEEIGGRFVKADVTDPGQVEAGGPAGRRASASASAAPASATPRRPRAAAARTTWTPSRASSGST